MCTNEILLNNHKLKWEQENNNIFCETELIIYQFDLPVSLP